MTQKFLSMLPLALFSALLLAVGYLFVREEPVIVLSTATPTPTALVPTPTSTPTDEPTSEPPDTPVSVSSTATPTSVPDTPTPTDPPPTPTNTPLPTTTASATPTKTPVPPTSTPTSTDTPTTTATPTVTPTFTRTPVPPDARVIATHGIDLHSGPGIETYDQVATVPQGTSLNILRPVVNNADWVKVSTRLESGQVVTGYVTTAAEAVQINVDLDEIPPIYEYGPHLLSPSRFESRSIEGGIEFSWEALPYPLEEHQYYSLILVRDDLSEADACFHSQTRETKLSLKPEDYSCTIGAYQWRVGIATDLSNGRGEDRIWRDDSEKDEGNPLGLGMPHPEKPKDSGSGGGGSTPPDVHVEPPGD